MGGFFAGRVHENVTTFRSAIAGGAGRQMLRTPIHNPVSETILRLRSSSAISQIPQNLMREVIDLQISGGNPDKAFMDKIKYNALAQNRLPEGSVDLLSADDYFAITPYTPSIGGRAWRPDQVLANDPEELRALIDFGNLELGRNSDSPGFSSAVVGLPAAGIASRAAAYAKQHPDLVARMAALGGLEGLGADELPPRFLYPIGTNDGAKTLLGLMLRHADIIGKDLSVIIPSLLMLHPNFSDFVLGRLQKEIGSFAPEQQESMALFTQTLARRMYLADQTFLPGQDPTGHGDFPNAMANYALFNYMAEQGSKYFVFSNADEILWSPNPFIIGIAKKLISRGYAGIVFVVPNTNNQSGGGAVKRTDDPSDQFLAEMPVMPASLLKDGKYPLGINTTFYVLDVNRFASVSDNLKKLTPALDIKTTDGRNGGSEIALTLESWAGSEFTNPYNKPEGFRMAFVFAPRAGFFTGIKTLEQSHSDVVPKELEGDSIYGSMSYQKYIAHLANTYPRILQMMTASDLRLMEPLFMSGGSYLLNI